MLTLCTGHASSALPFVHPPLLIPTPHSPEIKRYTPHARAAADLTGTRNAAGQSHKYPSGTSVLSITRRNTKLECTPLTPGIRVILPSRNAW